MSNTIKINSKPTLIITKELQSIISHYHSLVGAVEWSGPLFIRIKEGDIADPGSLVLEALHIHMMDIGSSTYTEVNQGSEEFMNVFEHYPYLEDGMMDGSIRLAMAHTHHNMAAFFSGTDQSELEDNCKNHPWYLSLVVNFSGQYVAKIAALGVQKIEYTNYGFSFKNEEKEIKFEAENNTKETICVMDCNVLYEVPENIRNQYTKVKETKKTFTNNNYGHGNHNNHNNNYVGSNYNYGYQGNLNFTGVIYPHFLGKLIMGDKNNLVPLYQAVEIFGKSFSKANQKVKKSVIERIIEDFPLYYAREISKKPTDIELKEAVQESLTWLLKFKDVPCIETLMVELRKLSHNTDKKEEIIDYGRAYGADGSYRGNQNKDHSKYGRNSWWAGQ